jgi:L,D-peptidoglycan transpeptidase YkuD (ErfK/YbiS/YcfS/YnhG family)
MLPFLTKIYERQMKIVVDTKRGCFTFDNQSISCAIGKHGAIAQSDKREGDGKTPRGVYTLRKIYARPDRVAPFASALPIEWLTPAHGWCDDPVHPLYNTQVMLPCAVSHEQLWREDGLYDVIVTLSHNDDPAVPHLGSAIFLHCCKYDEAGAIKPTLGCVAIPKADLLMLCKDFTPTAQIEMI